MKNLDEKIKRASERKMGREFITNQEQLDILDKRLGKGVGAQKERARLYKLIRRD